MSFKSFFSIIVCCISFGVVRGQLLMDKVDDSNISELMGSPAIIVLNDGSQISGTVSHLYLLKGRLIDVTLKTVDDAKRKFKPTEIMSLKVNLAKPTMISLNDDSGKPLTKVVNTHYVFQHPFMSKKGVKPDMMQILNPTFDKKIKIFADPTAGEARSISIKGVPLSTSTVTAYIVIKGDKVIYLDQTSYDNNYKALFGDCPKMIESISPENILFEGFAGHVLLYNYHCGDK
jgi:hypothetical protein